MKILITLALIPLAVWGTVYLYWIICLLITLVLIPFVWVFDKVSDLFNKED